MAWWQEWSGISDGYMVNRNGLPDSVPDSLLTVHTLRFLDDVEEFGTSIHCACTDLDTCRCWGTNHGIQGRADRCFLYSSNSTWWQSDINRDKSVATSVNYPGGVAGRRAGKW